MGTLAEPIFERDKKRVGGIVLTMPTIERRGRSRKSASPKGEARIDAICGVAPPRRSYHYAFVVAPCIWHLSGLPMCPLINETSVAAPRTTQGRNTQGLFFWQEWFFRTGADQAKRPREKPGACFEPMGISIVPAYLVL